MSNKQSNIDFANVETALTPNATTRLLHLLKTEFLSKKLNEHCFMHVIQHSTTVSADGSFLEILCIHLSPTTDQDVASILEATAIQFFKQEHKDLADNSVLFNGYQTLITGYAYPEQSSHFASVIITDETLYITYLVYPQ